MDSDDIESAGRSAASTAGSSLRAARDRISDTGSQAADHLRDVVDNVSATTSDAYERTKGRMQDMSERMPSASDAYLASKRSYAHTSDVVSRRVAKQPIEALLLAGAIGYLVGWASSRS